MQAAAASTQARCQQCGLLHVAMLVDMTNSRLPAESRGIMIMTAGQQLAGLLVKVAAAEPDISSYPRAILLMTGTESDRVPAIVLNSRRAHMPAYGALQCSCKRCKPKEQTSTTHVLELVRMKALSTRQLLCGEIEEHDA